MGAAAAASWSPGHSVRLPARMRALAARQPPGHSVRLLARTLAARQPSGEIARLPARLRTLAAVAALGASACATLPTAPAGVPFRGVPGFDTRVYPGDTALRAWRAASPYRWVGYYLPAPCHTDTSWVGRRAALAGMGWGVAAIFIGEQDWAATAAVAGPAAAAQAAGAGVPASPVAAGPRCTATNLTAARGAADAVAADSVMAAEGFVRGARVFLDVEPVDSVSTPLATYVRAWIAGLLGHGRFLPALYASARNADTLRALQTTEYVRAGITGPPAFWVAGGSGFDVHAAPGESPLPFATIWQGMANVTERWGGIALGIDVDVASTASPSMPGP